MHSSYTTDTIILSVSPRSERGVLVVMYTKDFGLIRAHASGVRSTKSRLKGHLQPLTIGTVRLIRGKEWRIATIVSELNVFFSSRNWSGASNTFARIVSIVPRLVHGEEKNEFLFNTLYEAGYALSTFDKNGAVSAECIEAVTVTRILSTLGYIASDDLTNIAIDPTLSSKVFSDMSEKWRSLIPRINEGLLASHL